MAANSPMESQVYIFIFLEIIGEFYYQHSLLYLQGLQNSQQVLTCSLSLTLLLCIWAVFLRSFFKKTSANILPSQKIVVVSFFGKLIKGDFKLFIRQTQKDYLPIILILFQAIKDNKFDVLIIFFPSEQHLWIKLSSFTLINSTKEPKNWNKREDIKKEEGNLAIFKMSRISNLTFERQLLYAN